MSTNSRSIALILVCLTCIVTVNVLAWTSWDVTYILNDGVQYLSTAKNWLGGHGFSTDALMFTPHFQGELPAPQTVWPPGYPLLIALTSMVGLSLETASYFVNHLFLLINAMLVLLILMRFRLILNTAVGCAMIFYFTAMPWTYSAALATEPVFSTLILSAIIFQPSNPYGKIWLWVVCGTFIALCVSVRYSGVLFSAGVGFGVFVYLLRHYRREPRRFWRGIVLLTLQISISAVLFLTLTYRTYLLTGTTDRSIGVIDTGNLIDRVKLMIWQVREFIGFTDGGILPGYVNKILFVCFVVVFFLVLMQALFVLVKSRTSIEPTESVNSGVMYYVIFGHTAVFAAFFSLNFVGIVLVDLTHRYLYQIYPGLFICFCVLVVRSFNNIEKLHLVELGKWFRRSITALAMVFLFAQINIATALKLYANPGMQAREVTALQVSSTLDLQALIQSCFFRSGSVAGSMWSNDGQQLHRATGVPTITVADVYGNKPYDLDTVRDHVATYDIKMFVILDNLPDIAPQYIKMLSDVKQWLLGNGYTQLPMLENTISNNIQVEVYAVEQGCLAPVQN